MIKLRIPTESERIEASAALCRLEEIVRTTPEADEFSPARDRARRLVCALVADPRLESIADWKLMARYCIALNDGFAAVHSHEAIARLAPDHESDPVLSDLMAKLSQTYGFDEHLVETQKARPDFLELFRKSVAGQGDAFAVGQAYGSGIAVMRFDGEESRWYRIAAQRGDTRGMVALSKQLRHGLGVVRNRPAAFRWALKAAQLGDPSGCVVVSHYYRDGTGCAAGERDAALWMERAAAGNPSVWSDAASLYLKFDVPKAIECFERSIELSIANGKASSETYVMTELAEIYRDQAADPSNVKRMLHWFERAASFGSADAMAQLGWLYETGKLVERDAAKATRWLEEATMANDRIGMDIAERFAAGGDGVARDDARARAWYEKMALTGNERAMIELALLQYEGRGGAADPESAGTWINKAAELASDLWTIAYSIEARETLGNRIELARPWYERLAQRNDYRGLFWLGQYHLAGWSGKRNREVAAAYFERWMAVRPAGEGHSRSAPVYEVGDLYAAGAGGALDDEEAIKWYERGALFGELDCMIRLGLFIVAGQYENPNAHDAQTWFHKAVASGNNNHHANEIRKLIGCCLRDGVLAPKDWAAAREWFKAASDAGDDEAAALLSDGEIDLDVESSDYATRMLYEMWRKRKSQATR